MSDLIDQTDLIDEGVPGWAAAVVACVSVQHDWLLTALENTANAADVGGVLEEQTNRVAVEAVAEMVADVVPPYESRNAVDYAQRVLALLGSKRAAMVGQVALLAIVRHVVGQARDRCLEMAEALTALGEDDGEVTL